MPAATPKSQLDVLAEAETLALRLSRPVQVKKNVLLSLVADFMSAPRPDRERLRETLELLRSGSGGHVLRAGGYGEQAKAALDILLSVFEQEGWTEADLKSLFGWTARLLQVKPVDSPAAPPNRTQTSPVQPRRPPPPAKPLGGLSPKGRDTLEELKKKLQGKENGDKR